jgi:hypothetical protein
MSAVTRRRWLAGRSRDPFGEGFRAGKCGSSVPSNFARLAPGLRSLSFLSTVLGKVANFRRRVASLRSP